jgi:hypothetical protein
MQLTFCTCNYHVWLRDNANVIQERGYKSAVASAFCLEPLETLSWGTVFYLTYGDFLETVGWGLLEDVPLAVRQWLWWFQHGGAAAYCGEGVRQWLNATYSGRWIWHQGPDLSPMEFFLWRPLKEQVCAVPPRSIEDLVARLQTVVTRVDANMLRYVRKDAVRRTSVCLEMDGGRFEHSL